MAQPAPRADSPEPTLEDVPPLAFESEDQIVDVLARLRKALQDKIRAKAAGLSADKENAVDLKKAEEVVLKNFYDSVRPILCSNCTIKGRPYAKYIAEKNAGSTSPLSSHLLLCGELMGKSLRAANQSFDDELHRRVVNYQETVFDLRTENVNLRKEVPFTTAKGIENILELDSKRLDQLKVASTEMDLSKVFEASEVDETRKNLEGAGPDPIKAEENFSIGNSHITRLLKEIPKLSTNAEGAAKVSVDAAKLI